MKAGNRYRIEEYKDFLFDIESEIPFKLHQSYEQPGDTKLVVCSNCGTKELEVDSGSYFTVIRCPKCKCEACIHDG